jgi:flagellar motor switch protein FliM
MGFGHEITTSLIDRMLGGTGKSELEARELTDIEHMLLKRVFEHTYNALEDAWKSFCPIKTKLMGTEDSYGLIQVATPSEIVALVTFEVIFGQRESGLMSLCIPYPVLEGVMGNLSAQHIMHRSQTDVNPEEQDKLLNKLYYAKTPVDVVFGHVEMPVLDLLQVQVGDVLTLDNRLDDDLVIRVNNKPKFRGKPGTLGRKLAAYVLDPIENIDELSEGILP